MDCSITTKYSKLIKFPLWNIPQKIVDGYRNFFISKKDELIQTKIDSNIVAYIYIICIQHMCILIHIIIYISLPGDAIVRLPYPRSVDGQGQKRV